MATKGTKNTKAMAVDNGSAPAIKTFFFSVPFVFFVANFLLIPLWLKF
jgi:hypothetical protein